MHGQSYNASSSGHPIGRRRPGGRGLPASSGRTTRPVHGERKKRGRRTEWCMISPPSTMTEILAITGVKSSLLEKREGEIVEALDLKNPVTIFLAIEAPAISPHTHSMMGLGTAEHLAD